jgi:hypothetical protein
MLEIILGILVVVSPISLFFFLQHQIRKHSASVLSRVEALAKDVEERFALANTNQLNTAQVTVNGIGSVMSALDKHSSNTEGRFSDVNKAQAEVKGLVAEVQRVLGQLSKNFRLA